MSTIIPAPGHTTVILSAEHGEYTTGENAGRYDSLIGIAAAAFTGGQVKAVTQIDGCYAGETEPSLAITLPHNEGIKFGKETGKLFEQESVLFVDSGGNGKLYFLATGNIEPIGQLAIVDSVEGLEAYSINRATGETFTFR